MLQETPVCVDAVISNEALAQRPSRPADRHAERRGIESLALTLAGAPRNVLQRLSDVALELCGAHSAGISLVEEEGTERVFRWHAVSGRYAPYLWGTLPRNFSPCGTVLDRKHSQLMILPERHFTELRQIEPKVAEVLLIPFSVGDVTVGTVWVVSHDDSKRFDSEDLRIVGNLAKFAAVAYAGLAALSGDDVVDLARLSKAGSLPRDVARRSIQRCVLIVDREADAAGRLAALLHDLGHRAHIAHDLGNGVRLAAAVHPHIVLLHASFGASAELRGTLGPEARIVDLEKHSHPEGVSRLVS